MGPGRVVDASWAGRSRRASSQPFTRWATPLVRNARISHLWVPRTGRFRQWLGTVPAARVGAVRRRLPFAVDVAAGLSRRARGDGHHGRCAWESPLHIRGPDSPVVWHGPVGLVAGAATGSQPKEEAALGAQATAPRPKACGGSWRASGEPRVEGHRLRRGSIGRPSRSRAPRCERGRAWPAGRSRWRWRTRRVAAAGPR